MEYSRYGKQVIVTATRLIPVWIEKRPRAAVPVWQPSAPKYPLLERIIWHYQGFYLESGRYVENGKWCNVGSLAAEDGRWASVISLMEEKNPQAAAALEMVRLDGRRHPVTAFPTVEPKHAAA